MPAFFVLGSQEALHSGRWALEPDLPGTVTSQDDAIVRCGKAFPPPLSLGPWGRTIALGVSARCYDIQISRFTKDQLKKKSVRTDIA